MQKNEMKICSDPYRIYTKYWWKEEDGKWKDMVDIDQSPLNSNTFIKSPISHNAYDIFDIIKDFCKSDGIKVTFEGTDDDFEDLLTIKNTYFSDFNIELVRGTKQMKQAKIIMPQIEKSFNDLKRYFGEYQDEKMKKVIAEYTDAVKPEIAVYVMGTYSSGKSAFINSIIGQEILPSGSDPETAKIYKIRASKKSKILFKYKGIEYELEFLGGQWKSNRNLEKEIGRKIEDIFEKHTTETTEQAIHWMLYALNSLEKNKKEEKLLDDIIEVYVEFVNSSLPLDKYGFVIYDSPGTDSKNFKEHEDILKSSLKQQTNGLPILITNPDDMDKSNNETVIEIIKKWGGALDISNMMIVVNKSDEKPVAELQKKSENKNNLFVTKWKANSIYFTSAIIGLGGKKRNLDEWIDEGYQEIFETKKEAFSNSKNKFYKRLFNYNIFPEDLYQRTLKKADSDGDDKILAWNSGILCIEEQIGAFAEKYALYNKSSQSIKYLKQAATMVKNDILEAQDKETEMRERLEKEFDSKAQKLMELLKKKCTEKKKVYVKNYVDAVITNTVKKYTDEERILGIIQKSYVDSQGKKDAEKIESFNRKVEYCFFNDREKYILETSVKIRNYWSWCAEDLRESLMKLVVESPDLTDEQKEILRKIILKVVICWPENKRLNIKETKAIEHQKIFFFLARTRINLKQAAEEYKNSLQAYIGESNIRIESKNEEAFDEWLSQLLKKLKEVLSSFNPKLKRLNADIERQNRIIEEKGKQKELIEKELGKIENLLQFEEVRV